MKQPPTIVCMGDEERAASHVVEALSLYYAGALPWYLEDDTVIDVANGTITIISEFHPEVSLFTPVDVDINSGTYRLRRFGIEHRKDGIIPIGLFSNQTPTDASYPLKVGGEFVYCSDGVGFSFVVSLTTPQASKDDRQDLIITASIMGVTEDLFQGGSGSSSTPQGFMNAMADFYSVVSLLTQGDALYSAAPYGVDRSGAYPKYTVTLGRQVYVDGAQKSSAYNNGTVEYVRYYEVYQAFSFLTAGKGATPDYNSYGLGVDVIENDADYSYSGVFHNAPFPVVIPLGNLRQFILYRERVTDATKIFGGSFRIQAYLVSTSAFTFTSPTVSGITGFLDTPAGYNCGPLNGAYNIPADALRVRYLFETLAMSSRTAVPLSANETVLFGMKDPLNTGVTTRWMCYSCTTSDITEKSQVVAFYETTDGTGRELNTYEFRGSIHLGDNKVAVYFFRRQKPLNGSTWSDIGIVRFLSTDNAVTWDSGTLCTYDSLGTNDGDVVSPRPIYIGETADDPPASIVAVGYADRENINAGSYKLKNAKVMSSEDNGATFVETHSVAGPLVFTAGVSSTIVPLGQYFNRTNGILALHQHGTPMNGFEPSPHKHLPTYYGTPTKASRDASNDAGL